jgi:hypothetical protein
MARKKPMSPNSLKNLKLIKKGEVKNPKGRGKGTKNRSTILEELLKLHVLDKDGKRAKHPLTGKGWIKFEELVDVALIKKAASGNIDAIKEIKDTIYGKIKEVHEIIDGDIAPEDIDKMTDEEAEKLYERSLKK